MTGHYQQMRKAHKRQREEDQKTWKRMQFTAQELDDLGQALAALATQPLDAAQAARIHALQQRIESSAAVLIERLAPEPLRSILEGVTMVDLIAIPPGENRHQQVERGTV